MPLSYVFVEKALAIKKVLLTKVSIFINILESDEPLHLCISSKFMDRYKIACNLVSELVQSVYEEYKKFCEKNNRTPVSCLAIRKEENLSTRKNKDDN
jgi:hypothetical protein